MAIRVTKNPTKDGRKYYFDVYFNSKRFRSKFYSTKQDAKKAEREWIKRQELNLNQKDFTFNEVIDRYIDFKKRNWKKSTEETTKDILNHIRYKLGSVKLSELNTGKYEAFLNYLDNLSRRVRINGRIVKKPYSARYKNRVLMYVKSVCDYADNHLDVKTKIPWLYDDWKQSEQRQIQILNVAEFDKFIAEVEDPRYRALFIFLMFTGCRRGEALALTFDDIDFENRTVTINKSFSKVENKAVSTKTQSGVRTLPLSARAFDSCLAMKKLYGVGYVFGGKRPLSFSAITRHKDKALTTAGLPRIRIHDFRHSFITMLVSQGVDVGIIARYAGHSSIKQTLDTYTHYYADKMKDVINSL